MKSFSLLSTALTLVMFLSACPSETPKTEEAQTTTTTTTETTKDPANQTTVTNTEVTTTTTQKVVGEPGNGAKVFESKGCIACHAIKSMASAKGVIGPALDNIGNLAATRVSGLDAEAYLRQSIEKPEAFLVPGYQDLMTKNQKAQMSEQEYLDLLSYLMTLKS